jgi:hypothetical protein
MGREKQKIGFLYFEEIHHIPHFIGIASALAKNYDVQVDILTFINEHEYLNKLINLLDARESINVIQLPKPLSRKIIDYFTGRKKPSPVYLYKKHKKLLLTYDALVFTEKNHKYIYKYRKGNKKPYLIVVNHGPAGRGYSFQPAIKLFDLTLLHGDFYINRLKSENLLIENYAKIGYSKFDVVTKENQDITIFNNGKPTVLYNPHFNKINSSFYKFGIEILEYFYNSTKYNLIFAPHIYMFNRKGFLKPDYIDRKYFNKDNIYIDLGSIKSSNMTYSLNSDIYLGDVSSQVYEFHLKPRPCVFINIEKVDWQNQINYRFWKTGHVISELNELSEVLKIINTEGNIYLEVQEDFFAENFHVDKKETASEKGAKAIHNFLMKKI